MSILESASTLFFLFSFFYSMSTLLRLHYLLKTPNYFISYFLSIQLHSFPFFLNLSSSSLSLCSQFLWEFLYHSILYSFPISIFPLLRLVSNFRIFISSYNPFLFRVNKLRQYTIFDGYTLGKYNKFILFYSTIFRSVPKTEV